jgi:hypothetical protein
VAKAVKALGCKRTPDPICSPQVVAVPLVRLPLDLLRAVMVVMALNAAMVVEVAVHLRSAMAALVVMVHSPVVVEAVELLQQMAQHQALAAMAPMVL